MLVLHREDLRGVVETPVKRTLSESSKVASESFPKRFGGVFPFSENACFASAKRTVRPDHRFRFQLLVFEPHEFDFAVGFDMLHARRRERRRL